MMGLAAPRIKEEKLHVILVGNNPIELSTLVNYMKKLTSRGVITEIAFNLKTLLERMLEFRPGYVFIDDNVGEEELKLLVNNLSSNKLTSEIPIAVLKNSNYSESFCNGISEYMLKSDLNEESLYKALVTALKFKKTRKNLYHNYQKKRVEVLSLIGGN